MHRAFRTKPLHGLPHRDRGYAALGGKLPDSRQNHAFTGMPGGDPAVKPRFGLRAEIAEASRTGRGDPAFFTMLGAALDIFAEAALRYAAQARRMARDETDDTLRRRLLLIEQDLTHIAGPRPETYHQAVQLLWLYSLVSLVKNYGRLDVVLGHHLCADLDSGRLTRRQAFDMTEGSGG